MNQAIVKCDCKHEYQDKKYGKYLRIANIKTKEIGKCVCTVCGKTHQYQQHKVL